MVPNTIISSQHFFESWYEAVHSKKEFLFPNWRKAKEFTNFIIGSSDSILSLIAPKLHPDLRVYEGDYYYIDSLFYFEEDRVPRLPANKFWFRRIRIAFEHENYINNVYQEFAHLLLVECDLRVLVSYPGSDDETKRQLDYFQDIIFGSRNPENISDEKSFLVIFGYERDFTWEGYIYQRTGWMRLPPYSLPH